jgi:WD40 repeat protein
MPNLYFYHMTDGKTRGNVEILGDTGVEASQKEGAFECRVTNGKPGGKPRISSKSFDQQYDAFVEFNQKVKYYLKKGFVINHETPCAENDFIKAGRICSGVRYSPPAAVIDAKRSRIAVENAVSYNSGAASTDGPSSFDWLDLESCAIISRLQTKHQINSSVISDDGRWLAFSGGWALTIVDLASDTIKEKKSDSTVYPGTFSRDGDLFSFSVSGDKKEIFVCSPSSFMRNSGTSLLRFDAPGATCVLADGTESYFHSMRTCLSPGGTRLAVYSSSSPVSLYEIPSGKLIETLPVDAYMVRFIDESRLLVSSTDDQRNLMMNLEGKGISDFGKKVDATISPPDGIPITEATQLAVSHDGSLAAAGFPYYGIVVIRTSDGEPVFYVCTQRHTESLGFSGDDRYLLSCDSYGRLIVYDIRAAVTAGGHAGPHLLP